MTHAERVTDIVRAFDLQISEDAQAKFLAYLKRQAKDGDKAARDALVQVVALWVKA